MSSLKRQDLLPVIALITLLFLWGPISRIFFPPAPPATPSEIPERTAMPAAALSAPTMEPALPLTSAQPEADLPSDPRTTPDIDPGTRQPEQRLILTSPHAEITLSSWGAGVRQIRLLRYRATLDADSPPVVLPFDDHPALSYQRVDGFSEAHDFTVLEHATDRVRFQTESRGGLVMVREFAMDPDNAYRFLIHDRFENTGSAAIVIDRHDIAIGPLRPESDAGPRSPRTAGLDLGLDALPSGGGQRVRHWTKKRFMSSDKIISDLFYPEGYRGGGCSPFRQRLPQPLPPLIEQRIPFETDWVAVKNKFFVQILAPEHGASGYRFSARRTRPESEHPDRPETWSAAAHVQSIAAVLEMPIIELEPGEITERRYSYYAGPKQYSALQKLGNHQEVVMEFGRLRFFCGILLSGLNGLHRVIPSYGIAVMLLTILIRIIFWPITRKSTESMRRMQELQPEMQALRTRFKDNPQKMQQETMALYKKHKVNPVAGCLPMVIQIPVFFALFTVLRSAVELRFAPFLWVPDLSEPENLLAGMIPLVGALNILPILMTVTMIWQQHLTPSAGDPSQRKMMMLMPVMMLVFFYSMPSALVLYWTTNQCLMIVQLLWQRHKKSVTGTMPTPPQPIAPPALKRKRKP